MVEDVTSVIEIAAPRERVWRALRLAEQLGGEAVTIPASGRHVARDLVRYAQERNVSEMVLGKPRRPRWLELWRGSLVDEVIRRSGAIGKTLHRDLRADR